MEAVPRLPMLSFELRTSVEKVEFAGKLKQYIRSHYNEDPTLYASGITSIESMRREAVYPSKSIEGCSLLKRYFCQLNFMASRFPMRENEEAAVPFSWKSLHSNSVITLNDITLEMASILYNIGALHTQLGALNNRTNPEGMKMSCTHFQCAAWAFQHINEEYPFAKSLGLSPTYMSFLYHLCLAQAQECILEKSMMDNRKSAITAKLAVQVVDYYKQSLKLLGQWPQDESNSSEIYGLKLYKKLEKYVHFKIAYYDSISLLFQGQQSEDQQKMGERVAFYQAAFDKLEETRKLPPGVDNTDNVTEALIFVHDVIEVKRKAAKNENQFIYHEGVPSLTDLPKIKGASLVKGIPFSINDPEVCGPDLFSSIVPMRAHESSSLYSEEKAKLLRRINGLIENKDEELETFLSMLDLDEIKSKMDGNKLPQELVDRCAALNAKTDAIQNLTEAMNKLSDIYQDVESMLNEIKEFLKEEENHEKEYQQMVGKRPPSIAATDLTREAKKYQEAHAKASESNQTLHKAMIMHVSNLKLLSMPLKELINHIPTVTESPEVEAVSNEMRHLISKVEEMKQQRLMLAAQLRDTVCQDDITGKVITYSGDKIEDLFVQELKKYDKVVSLIEQNLAAQENILRALKETYAKYGATRKSTGELQRRRSAMITSLIASYDAYEDLITKSSKGLDFYKKLETNVSKLLQRVKGTCKVQDEEREQMMKSVKKPDVTVPQTDAPPSQTLKLKDYLNIKKETGKLSLEPSSNVTPAVTYYNDPTVPQQTWVPSIRPAPVGSEETDSNMKTQSDSFRGFYQGQGKDPIWSNTAYSLPQDLDQKLKFSLPSSTYPSYSQSISFSQNQDLYPISSYSTTLPKTEGGYEPKSNYYDVQNSPNRTYHPPQAYSEGSISSSTASIPSYTSSDFGYNQSIPSYGQNPVEASSRYNYNSQIPPSYPQASGSHHSLSSYSSNDVASVPYVAPTQNQLPSANPVTGYNSSAYSQTQAYSTEASQATYNATPYNPYATNIYNSYGTSQANNYADQSSLSNTSGYSTNYQTPSSQTPVAATYPAPSSQPAAANYQTPSNQPGVAANYPTSSSQPAANYQTPSSQPGVAANYPTPSSQPATANYQAPSSQATVAANYAASIEQNQNYQNIQMYQPNSNNIPPINQSSTQLPNSQPVYNYPNAAAHYASQATDTSQSTANASQTSWQNSYNSGAPSQQYFQSGNESLYTSSHTPNNYSMTNSDIYKTVETNSTNYQNYGNQYYTNQYGAYAGQAEVNAQIGNPVTYMQAGTDKQQAVTTTTFSNSEAKSSPITNSSNVDLLAGLDFNINHSPLQPETAQIATPSQTPPTPPVKKEETSVETKPKTPPKNTSESLPQVNSNKAIVEKIAPKDIMVNMETVNHFAQEVEKYEKFVEGLTLKTLNGPTTLDLKWKEVVDMQEKVSPQHIISVARCYPMKNRFPDILPYDDSRVELPSTKDDYINASKMMDFTKLTPPFILTQAPLPSTYSDFWAMVFEQQVEVIVCLLSDTELDGHTYWPSGKGQELEMGKLKISLQSSNVRSNWVERILSICVMETRMTRVVVHLQFTAWPGSSFPESPGPFLSFSSECINFFTQQRSYSHPVVVHCMSGVGRTGLFCLIVASILEIQAGKGLPDLAGLAGRMCQYRKSCLRDREHLKFAYQTLLYFSQDFLMKRGILTSRTTFEDKKSKEGKCHTRHPSEDFLVPSASDLGQIQTGVERLDIADANVKKPISEDKNLTTPGRSQSVCSSVSCTSSGRSSPSSLPPDILSTLDSANFSLKVDGSEKKKKRFTPESFNKNSITLDASSSSNDDPLSKLDPLWTIKK